MNYRYEDNRDQSPREGDHELRYQSHLHRYDQPASYDADPLYDRHPDSHYDDGHYGDRDHEAQDYGPYAYDDHHHRDHDYDDQSDAYHPQGDQQDRWNDRQWSEDYHSESPPEGTRDHTRSYADDHHAHEDQQDQWHDQQWSDDYDGEATPEINLYPPVDDTYQRNYDQPLTNDGATYAHRIEPQFARSAGAAGSGIRLNDDDLRDVGNLPFARYTGHRLAKVAAVILFFAFGALVVTSVKPTLSAYDIVSMDSYEGQQQAEWMFDTQEADGCDSLSACFKESLAQQKKPAEPDFVVAENAVEIPANSVPLEPQIVVEAAEVVDYNTDTMRVAKQWSNIRDQPGMSGSIVTAIPSGLEVRVLGKVGSWYEIVTGDNRAIQGFMHQSTLR